MSEVWTAVVDRSHYDAPFTARDGVDGYTHKVTEGDHYYLDAQYGADAARAHDLGCPVLGSYHVLHGQRSLSSQADWWFAQVAALSPWWATFPAWTWQCDAERFSYYTAPTIDEINGFGDLVCALARCPAERYLAYAPEWLYGSQLARLRYRQWESSYVSGAGPYRDLYPGNASPRWATAAPGGPLLLQYSSSAIVAGQTTCDVSGYRGSTAELLTALRASGGDMGTVYKISSTDPAWDKRWFVSNGVHSREIRTKGSVGGPGTTGMTSVTLTDAGRADAGNTWEDYVAAVAGPAAPECPECPTCPACPECPECPECPPAAGGLTQEQVDARIAATHLTPPAE